MATNVVIPHLGDAIEAGTLVRWIKTIGSPVQRDEALCEISTDKVDVEIPSPESGVLLEIRVREGETVAVNQVVAIVGDPREHPAPPAASPSVPRSATVFLCYRREDTQSTTGRLHDRLVEVYGAERVFMDIDSVPLGADFVDYVGEQVASCCAVIVMIGQGWLKAKGKRRGRRLDAPDDLVRVEIAAALKQRIPVIPVLVDDASMPLAEELPEDIRLLTRRNGIALSHTRWRTDVQRLLTDLDKAMRVSEAALPAARVEASPAARVEAASPAARVEASLAARLGAPPPSPAVERPPAPGPARGPAVSTSLPEPSSASTENATGVFLCYRREDALAAAGKLHEALVKAYGGNEVLMDTIRQPPGAKAWDVVPPHLARCRVVLVVMGRNFLKALDKGGRRLVDNRQDLVRVEIAVALRQSMRIIPVLVDDMEMPAPEQLPENIRALARLQGSKLSYTQWRTDVERLLKRLDTAMGRRKDGPAKV